MVCAMSPVMESLAHRYDAIRPHLTERQRRVWLGAEARELGSSGVRTVAEAVRVIKLVSAATHGVRGDPHRLGHGPHPARPQLTGLGAKPDPALPLGQVRPDRVVPVGKGLHHGAHSTD